MSFEETRYPDTVDYGSAFGIQFSTRIIEAASGFEDRNANWAQSRHPYDLAYGVTDQAALEILVEWYQAMKGPATGFRLKDYLDFKSCYTSETQAQDDQVLLASAVGGETTTQLIKTYTVGSQSTVRDINKPVGTGLGDSTVLIERNGGLLIEGTDYDLAYTTGLITWDTGVFPSGLTSSDIIKAGFEYDVPVRFKNDTLSIVISHYLSGTATVPAIEIKI